MIDIPDLDLEVQKRDTVVELFDGAYKPIVATIERDNRLVPHGSGLHFQAIPRLPGTSMAAFPYDVAEAQGFSKIDLLACPNPYDGIVSMDELRTILAMPIDWNWFKDVEFVSTLFHLGGRVNNDVSVADVVVAYSPNSITDLAILLAIKLPPKRYLIGESWDVIREKIWIKEQKGVQFKKSHSYGYAVLVGIDAKRKKRNITL